MRLVFNVVGGCVTSSGSSTSSITGGSFGQRSLRGVCFQLLDDRKRVTDKQNLLFELADATLAKPDGMVREVVFSVVVRRPCVTWRKSGRLPVRPTVSSFAR